MGGAETSRRPAPYAEPMAHQPEGSREISSQRRIAASPERIFALLTDIDRHPALDGAGMLTGRPEGPRPLQLGSRFTMGMRQGPFGYRSLNTVVEYEQDRLIAWQTAGEFRGRVLVGGHRWRYRLTPLEDGATLVRESYDWSTAKRARLTIELPGYPARMGRAMAETLARLDEMATAS